MARYYFHLHNGFDALLDPDGAEMPINDAVARALVECRALIAHEALEGRIDLRQRIDVEDETGSVLHSISFQEAVQIVSQGEERAVH